MKVVIFEVCRSPEIVKPHTEATVLSKIFAKGKIDYALFSNDGVWQNHYVITKALMEQEISKPEVAIVHLAMHGFEDGLVLRWSESPDVSQRVVEDLLSADEIKQMKGWQQKLIVSGACSSLLFADAFLEAGSVAVIAPTVEIPWNELGAFFRVFYRELFVGQSIKIALGFAINQFPQYSSFGFRGKDIPIQDHS